MSKTLGRQAREAFSGTSALSDLGDELWNAVADFIIEECAKVADEFHWELPFYADPQANELTDNTAEQIRSQVATAIRSLKTSTGEETANE